MNNKNNLLIVAIIILVVILFAFLYKLNQERVEQQHQVLMIRSSLPRATRLSMDQVYWKYYEQPNPNFFVQRDTDINQLLGGVILHDLKGDEPLTKSDIAPLNSPVNYSELLRNHKIAYTLSVPFQAMGGAAGGNYVDVYLTYSDSFTEDKTKNVISKLLIKNVLILLSSNGGSSSTNNFLGLGGENAKTNGVAVVLEVTPKQAEILNVAAEMGVLSLSLSTPGNHNYSSYVTTYDIRVPLEARKNLITIIKGSQLEVRDLWGPPLPRVLNGIPAAAPPPAPAPAPAPAPTPAPQNTQNIEKK